MLRRHLLATLLIALLPACTGLSFGESVPGGDTYLEAGAIAVDPDTDTAFMLSALYDEVTDPDTGETTRTLRSKTLYAASPDSDEPRVVGDFTAYDDLRILFPRDRIMIMAEQDDADTLITLDKETFAELQRAPVEARYNGTRTSPSGDFVVVCDNNASDCPIHMIDTQTLDTIVIPHDGEWLEAMWLNDSETLVAIVFYDRGTPETRARVLSWSMEGKQKQLPQLKADPTTGFWPEPLLDVALEGVDMDFLFSFTWVGISPDDRYGVFPVRRPDESLVQGFEYELRVVDLSTGDVRTVDNAQGPVGFTPDGSGVISYRHDAVETTDAEGDTRVELTNARLLVVDLETLTPQEVDLPFERGPSYFVTRDGNFVMVTSANEDQSLLLYDLDNESLTELGGPTMRLNEFVSRTGHSEVWLIDNGVHRLDLLEPSLERVSLSFGPSQLNYLPARDLLVFNDTALERFVFFDPEARSVTRSVLLPQPID